MSPSSDYEAREQVEVLLGPEPLKLFYASLRISHGKTNASLLMLDRHSAHLCETYLPLNVFVFLFDVLPADLSRVSRGLESRHPLPGDLPKIVCHFFE
jgi:hypothetical protein